MGLNEDEAKAKGLEYKTGKFSFMANSRARAVGDTDGMVRGAGAGARGGRFEGGNGGGASRAGRARWATPIAW